MKIFVIDTNVILLAGTRTDQIPEDQIRCYEKCILFLQDVMDRGDKVLIDDDGMVINEYRKAYSVNDYPNMAAMFFEYSMGHYVCCHVERIEDDVYSDYPQDITLQSFDPPDRKFIALAYVYDHGTPIVEGTDSKWWAIKDNLRKYGIEIIFIDEEYIRDKYTEKFN